MAHTPYLAVACRTVSPSYGECQATEKRVSGFSSLESNEVAKFFFRLKVERVADFESRLLLVLSCPLARVGQGSLLSGMSGVTAHDARYASLQEERARPTHQRVLSTQGRTRARAAPKSKGLNLLLLGNEGFLRCGRRVTKAPAFDCSPRTGVWGRAPSKSPKTFGHFENALAPNHDQVEFLSTDPSGLQSPQIDHQLQADCDHGFVLHPPVSAPQDFLPFLDHFLLGLEPAHPPAHLGDNPTNCRCSYFGNGAEPLAISGTPLAGHHPGQTTDLTPVTIKPPVQDLALQLNQTRRSGPFGPWTAAALARCH